MEMNKILLGKFSKNHKVYREVFNTPSGKMVLKDLAKFCGQNSPTYVSGDSHASAYREGMRRVFLRIQSLIDLDEGEMRKLIKQHN